MSLADVAFYYVSGAITVLVIMLVCEAIRYVETITDHIDWIVIVTTGVFWPVYAVKYGLKLLTAMLNRLIYDIIHW